MFKDKLRPSCGADRQTDKEATSCRKWKAIRLRFCQCFAIVIVQTAKLKESQCLHTAYRLEELLWTPARGTRVQNQRLKRINIDCLPHLHKQQGQ